MRGQEISILPDSSGLFLRDTGGNASNVREIQGYAIRNISGEISGTGNNGIFQAGISNFSGVFGNSSLTGSTTTRNNETPYLGFT